MTKTRLPKSLRKFLRREKARMRREVLGVGEVEKKIKELVEKTFGKYKKVDVATPQQMVYI